MNSKEKKVVIIGGGITGLTTAFYLQKQANEKGLPISFKLVEASKHLGGKISTVQKDGFTIERGPDSFLERKVSAGQLVRDLGLGDQLVNNSTGTAHVLVNNELFPIPEGAVMGIPTKITPFITSGLFSPVGKLRAAADLILPKSGIEGDQSLGHFFRRRLGSEVVENLIEPLLSGIYAGDIDQLSLESTFPQFKQVESKYRSLILGMKTTSPQKKETGKSKKGIFQTVSSGLSSIVDTIGQQLPKENVLLERKVLGLEKSENGYFVSLDNGEKLEANYVVLATPHLASSEILKPYGIMEDFEDIPSTSVATVAMAYPLEAFSQLIEGTGFVVSRNSPYTITACTWTHKKWPHTVPKGKALIRCYVGKAGDEDIVYGSDDEILQAVKTDLQTISGVTTEPDFVVISRWKKAMPQYVVGHKERLNKMKETVQKELPNVFVVGSSFEGLGLPDCIDQGKRVVEDIIVSI
ncbi:protoporphyrinogen oxidase [Bacillus salitolerans]|uniref:Coproporphyrinogen III oxidase n=1 Tax=Bacillus salitolerans TaxID=1437434 RepID=A0ABW4LW21_9BACI